MSTKPLIQSQSVILATGGARGITAQCVIHLAERSHSKFILLGRSKVANPEPEWATGCLDETDLKKRLAADLQRKGEKPTPATVQKMCHEILAGREISQTLQAIQASGGQAEYICADVANATSLQENLAPAIERFGPVTGIIHGAGSLADKRIEKKTEHDFDSVYSPKVQGLENLLRCVSPRKLDFLILFSSVAGLFGNVGQADYAIANEVMNKATYLIHRDHPDCHVLSINWGPWDGGMVTPELKRLFAERKIQVIPVEAGVEMLADELISPRQDALEIMIGSQPIFPAVDPGPELKQYRICRSLKLESNPFLLDHVIGNHPVLPATCAAMWACNAAEGLYPGYTFLSLENFKVLKGIVFDEKMADEYILDLQEIMKDPGESVQFEATIWSKNPIGKTFYHYSVGVTLVRQLPQAAVVPPWQSIQGEAEQAIPGMNLYHDGTLFHGPSFQGIQRIISLDPNRMTLEVNLPPVAEKNQGQFPVQTGNPYIYDAIVQSLLVWAQRYYQAPCLPSSLKKFEQFKPVPFGRTFYVTLEVTAHAETFVVGNILVQDQQGNVYVRISGLEGTISKQLKRFIGG